MDCPACSFANRDDAGFCGECGNALAADWECQSCHRANPVGRGFCDGCGSPRVAGPTSSPGERKPYTPKHLTEKILRSKSALEGERKQVTVLFADVSRSMELAQDLDPEEWHRLLDRFFQILSEGVHRFEGTVNQYTGDGIMALFGAPIAHEDHAQRACYAALHLQDELREFADDLRRTESLNFSVRIGLNSGEVVVGKIGNDARMDYTAQGHTVGLAQRVEQIAAPDRINVTEHTAALVEGYVQLRDLGEFSLKGVRNPLQVFELDGLGAFRTRLDRSRERGFSKFVGRAGEIEILDGARDQALAGSGQVVGVVGEAGVGKSRLCYEFVELCRARGIAVYEAHCPAHGKTVPFLPLLELLRAYFGLSERDSDTEARRKIAGTALLLDEGFRELLPLLFDFLGVPDPDQPAPSMDPEARQRQLFGFVRSLVRAQSEREPTLLFVDDLHWIDPPSDAFLAQIVEAVEGTQTLLLVNFRPEYQADWMQKSVYQQLPLVPLGPEAIQQLLADLLGEDESLTGLADLIHERTHGNPFFIEEVVQSLVEAGSLVGVRGAYRLAIPVATLEIPEAVLAVLAARIDRLGERDKRVLQTAAVIGKLFPRPILERVAEVPEPDLAAALGALESAEFVVQEALYPEVIYGFKHPLTQQAALHSQLGDRRARLHASVAGALTEVRAERLDESAALIAFHWEEAGEALEAARWHRRAAEWAGASDTTEADAHWRKVDDLLGTVSRSAEADALRATAIAERVSLAMAVGLHEDEVDALYLRGEGIARERGELRTIALLEGYYGVVKGVYNRFDQSLVHSQKAVSAAREIGDRALELAMHVGEARALLWLTRDAELVAVFERAIELADGDAKMGLDVHGFSPLLFFELTTAGRLCYRGQPREARLIIERAIRRGREIGLLQTVGLLHGDATLVEFLLGDASRALAHGHQTVEIAEKFGSRFFRAAAAHWHCWAQLAATDWVGLIETAERVDAINQEFGVGLDWRGPVGFLRSAAELGLGRPEQARKSARDAVDVIRNAGNRVYEGFAHVFLARALLEPDTDALLDEAEAALAAAVTSIEETGHLMPLPFLFETRAEVARLRGDSASRERDLRGAERVFTEMGATAHADRIAALLAYRAF